MKAPLSTLVREMLKNKENLRKIRECREKGISLHNIKVDVNGKTYIIKRNDE